MTDDYQEPPEIKSIDFSEFHPLDHSLLRCSNYAGGRRRHLDYWWTYQGEPGLRARTLCLVGLHRPTQVWSRQRTWTGCMDCDRRLSTPQTR